MKNRYQLLKDLPGVPAFAIFKFNPETLEYVQVRNPSKKYKLRYPLTLQLEAVENNPEWFKELTDEESLYRPDEYTVRKQSGEPIEYDEFKRMDEAIRKKLYSEEEIIAVLHNAIFASSILKSLKENKK